MSLTHSRVADRMRKVRAGFTTLELLIAMSVTLVLISLAAPLYQAQSKAVGSTAGRTDAARSATFAADAMEQDLRNTGVGVFDGQPLIVNASQYSVTFNANMVTARANDLVSVFYDPDADSAALGVLRPSAPITLPLSSTTYPSVRYNSNAETISYYVQPDTVNAPVVGALMYRLMRRVNRLAPEVIARNIMLPVNEDIRMLRYFKRGLSGNLIEIPPTSLPIFHQATRHGSTLDTGATAAIDSISVVRVTLVHVYKDPRGGSVIDTLQRNIRIANSGLLVRAQCGEAPLVPGAPTGVIQYVSGVPWVRLTWPASTDELTGERDVEMYALYRRPFGSTDWGEPYANVPGAGLATLTFQDNAVVSGDNFEYAVTALDCTPAPSQLSPSVSVPVP
jgi:type II secretory pathway pseudopilin PulG